MVFLLFFLSLPVCVRDVWLVVAFAESLCVFFVVLVSDSSSGFLSWHGAVNDLIRCIRYETGVAHWGLEDLGLRSSAPVC